METGSDSNRKASVSARAVVSSWNILVETDVCVGRRQPQLAPSKTLVGIGSILWFVSAHLGHKAVFPSPSAGHPGEAVEVSWLLSTVESIWTSTSVVDTAGYEQHGNAWPGAWKVLETPPGMGSLWEFSRAQLFFEFFAFLCI